MQKKDQEPCGCIPRSESRALVLYQRPEPVIEPDPDATGEWPAIKPELPAPPPTGWDAIT